MRKPTTPADLGFTARDRRQPSQALADAPQARVFGRLQAVLLMAQGYTAQASAKITGLSLRSVYHWVKRFLVDHQIRRSPQPIALGSSGKGWICFEPLKRSASGSH